MISKKIFSLITLAILTILFTGLVSASILDSTGSDPEKSISIEKTEFNIPDGYVKNDSKSIVNETKTVGNDSYILNQETFQNNNSDEITFSIIKFNNFDVDADTLDRICEGVDNKTLRGYPGYICDYGNYTNFTYAYNNRAVTISAPNEELINQVLVVEDA